MKMAYVSKEDKVKIVAAVKAVLPKDWKATFAVRNGSTIVMTIKSTPFSLEEILFEKVCDQLGDFHRSNGFLSYVDINHRCLERYIKNEKARSILEKVVSALNTDNYNNSDITTDYFDVGHYVDLKFGNYNKPYTINA